MKPTIVVSEDGMFSSEPISVVEICNIFCAALTGAVQDIRPNYKNEPDAPKIDKELFDCLNYSFSKCLEITFPEYELHPEITEEVLKKEEALLKEKVAALEANPPEEVEVMTLDGNKENLTKEE
jgi:uncharacterized HAD superfamily protein